MQNNQKFHFLYCVGVHVEKFDVFKATIVNQLLQQHDQHPASIYSATELMVERFQKQFFSIERDKFLHFQAYILSNHFFAFFFKRFNTDMAGNNYKTMFTKKIPSAD